MIMIRFDVSRRMRGRFAFDAGASYAARIAR